jgi:hypothetical protein
VTQPAHLPQQFVILEKDVANETVRLDAPWPARRSWMRRR